MLPALTISEPLASVNMLGVIVTCIFLLIAGQYHLLFAILAAFVIIYILSIVIWRDMCGWLLLLALGVCSIFSSVVMPIFLLLLSFNSYQLYHYYGKPWRRVHYPLMRVYASAVGSALGHAEAHSKKFDPNFVLGVVALTIHPDFDEKQLEHYLDLVRAGCHCFDDELALTDYITKEGKFSHEEVRTITGNLREWLQTEELRTMVQMIIAGVIESRYSKRDRIEYIYALLTGVAK